MSSPMIPCPIQYNDIPGGGALAIIQVAQIAPSSSQNQYQIGTFWLNTTVPHLYILSSFSSGVPQWTQII